MLHDFFVAVAVVVFIKKTIFRRFGGKASARAEVHHVVGGCMCASRFFVAVAVVGFIKKTIFRRFGGKGPARRELFHAKVTHKESHASSAQSCLAHDVLRGRSFLKSRGFKTGLRVTSAAGDGCNAQPASQPSQGIQPPAASLFQE